MLLAGIYVWNALTFNYNVVMMYFDLSVCLLISQMVCEAVDTERVLGLHLLGPSAGEVLQGFSAAMK